MSSPSGITKFSNCFFKPKQPIHQGQYETAMKKKITNSYNFNMFKITQLVYQMRFNQFAEKKHTIPDD